MLSRFSPRATHPAASRTLQTADCRACSMRRRPSAHFITTRSTPVDGENKNWKIEIKNASHFKILLVLNLCFGLY